MTDFSRTELISQGKTLAVDLEHNWLALSRIIKQLHPTMKTETAFRDACKQIGIGARTGYYLLRLARRFAQLELEPPTDVSWRLLLETLPCLRRDNYQRILTFCRTHARDEVIRAVKTYVLD